MKIILLSLIPLLAYSIPVTKKLEDGYFELSNDNDKEITFNEIKKVIFFTSKTDCFNCDKIRKNLQTLIDKNEKLSIITLLIDCDKNEKTCQSHIGKRKAPAIVLVIGSKLVFYYGDYSPKSIQEFIDKRYITLRLQNYSQKAYEEELEKSKKTQNAIVIYGGYDDDFKNVMLLQLSQHEAEDAFFICANDEHCLKFFNKPEKDLIFIKANRKIHLQAESFKTFEELQTRLYNFKNIFFIPFGVEFERKVIDEMSQTVILTIYEENEQTKNEIQVFKEIMTKYSKRCFASIIKVYELDSDQKTLFKKFQKEIGLSKFPKLMAIEPDMDTMKIQKYFYSFIEIIPEKVNQFLQDWINRKIEPTKKSQKVSKNEKYEGFSVINHDMFKDKVFIKEQESIVLIHKNFSEDKKSKNFLENLKKLTLKDQFSGLKYFLIDGDLNDLPVFFVENPSFLIFSKNSWENPLVFDKDNFKQLVEIVEKRKELTIGGGDGEEDPDLDLKHPERIFDAEISDDL